MPSASLLRCSVAFALGIPIVACSDGDGVAPDAFPAVPSVVGTWRRIPTQLDAHPPPARPARPQLVYEIDGTLTFREVARTRVYDYVIEADGTITATDRGDGTPHVETYQYRVSGDRYIDNVMTPQGTVVGAVGTWAGTSFVDGDRLDKTWELHADQTARLAFNRTGQGSWSFPGTWRAVGGDVRVVVQLDEVTTDVVFATIDDGVLGVPYEAVR